MTDFIHVVMEMRGGRVAADLNAKFQQVLKGVLEHNGKGELNIKFTFAPSRLNAGAVIEIEASHECRLKVPEEKMRNSVFFVTADGELTRDDPQQVEMFKE